MSYRGRKRAEGLRLVQMWLPDTRSEKFAQQAAREAALVAAADRAGDDQDFVDAISVIRKD